MVILKIAKFDYQQVQRVRQEHRERFSAECAKTHVYTGPNRA